MLDTMVKQWFTVRMDKTPLDRAVDAVPGKTKRALAQACGVKPQAVSQWFSRGIVPVGRCLAIEDATRGSVTRYELRPDIFGDKPDSHAAA